MSPTHSPRPVLALGLRLLGVTFLSVMTLLVKLAGERGIHVFEMMFWRHLTTVPLVLVWLGSRGNLSSLRTPRFGAHLRRAILGTVGMSLMFGSFVVLPLAEATTLNFTVPLFATILAIFMLKDRVGYWRWSALIVGFGGVLVIAQPGHGHLPLAGAALGLSGAFMIALLSILVKDLNRTDQPLTIVFWFAAIGAPMMALSLPFVMTGHDSAAWLLLLGIGVIGTIGQLMLTLSLRLGSVSSVTVMDYSGLIWATLFGWIIWDHLPPATTWLGAPLIVAAGILIVWREHKLSREKPDAMLSR
ncbi:MAG: DMT family transporter [Novosphingobium sp.]|nr:DMT family transporter [Novosphingobium sp.]MCP5379056.1 DMT family transporter [Novosphingobium sp.]MCP5388850.1 DMT family transporter [Novosphingobium sp.]